MTLLPLWLWALPVTSVMWGAAPVLCMATAIGLIPLVGRPDGH